MVAEVSILAAVRGDDGGGCGGTAPRCLSPQGAEGPAPVAGRRSPVPGKVPTRSVPGLCASGCSLIGWELPATSPRRLDESAKVVSRRVNRCAPRALTVTSAARKRGLH